MNLFIYVSKLIGRAHLKIYSLEHYMLSECIKRLKPYSATHFQNVRVTEF